MGEQVYIISKYGSCTINGYQVATARESGVITSKVVTNGKWFWEVDIIKFDINYKHGLIGIASNNITDFRNSNYSLQNNISYADWAFGLTVIQPKFFDGLNIGDVLGVFLDADKKEVILYKNGVKINTLDVSNLNNFSPFVATPNSNALMTIKFNFGNEDFKFIPDDLPSGAISYDGSKNLTNRLLLQSNNKTFSLDFIDKWYEPKMTSNTSPSPYLASASSIWNGTYEPYKAFNGTNTANTDAWITVGGTIKGWILLDFGSPISCNQIKLTSRAGDTANACPKDFTITASNDGVVFEEILSITGQTKWTLNETRKFTFKNNKKYRIFKLTIISNDGYSSYSAIGQLQFGYKSNSIIELPNSSVDNFMKYGKTALSEPNKPITIKSYILQDDVSKNTDGLLTTKLDRKPLSISFT